MRFFVLDLLFDGVRGAVRASPLEISGCRAGFQGLNMSYFRAGLEASRKVSTNQSRWFE